MEDRGTNPTCLSEEYHGAEVIRNFSTHYFGCIKISERPQFLDRSNPLWDEELRLEMRRLRHRYGEREDEINSFEETAEKNNTRKI